MQPITLPFLIEMKNEGLDKIRNETQLTHANILLTKNF